jgi:DNA (cytosine-5)-methyltransferase 1
MAPVIRDLFAGPGGWGEGLRLLGHRVEDPGYDISGDACATAEAAGHPRKLVDLTDHEPDAAPGEVDGVIASPTCRPWSAANTSRGGGDPRRQLIDVPLRWVLALRPRWTAWEITPLALPVFERHAVTLRAAGYDVATGLLRAPDFGVAADRTRALLVGRLDGAATLPAPTHTVPVSMAQCLGWNGAELVSNYGTGGDPARRGRRSMDRQAFTITGKCGRNRWEWPDGTTRRMTVDEAAQLQGFPAGYPWQGGSISRQQQVGDTVPPPLAAAVLRPLVSP